jgi:hypothetical protein
MAARRDYLAFNAANAVDNRLEFYNEYPMPDYVGMATCPASHGRRRVRNPDGIQHRCRIISNSELNANGYELFHNKIKKWIKRKSIITRVIVENIRKKFPRMNYKDHQKIFKEFLMVAEGEDEEKDIKKRREFYEKINSNERRLVLSSKEVWNEFFENHYTETNLLNPKSQGIACNKDGTTIKIKSRRSNRCIMAYRLITLPDGTAIAKSGFDNYAQYLLTFLTNLFPKRIYFDKFIGNRLMEMYLRFFPDDIDDDDDNNDNNDDGGSD